MTCAFVSSASQPCDEAETKIKVILRNRCIVSYNGGQRMQFCDGGEPTPAPEIIPMNTAKSPQEVQSSPSTRAHAPTLSSLRFFTGLQFFEFLSSFPFLGQHHGCAFPSVLHCAPNIQIVLGQEEDPISTLWKVIHLPIATKCALANSAPNPCRCARSMPRSFWRSRGWLWKLTRKKRKYYSQERVSWCLNYRPFKARITVAENDLLTRWSGCVEGWGFLLYSIDLLARGELYGCMSNGV